MKTSKVGAALFSACLIALPAMAADAGRTLVTDPEVLASMGFPRDARNVYMADGLGKAVDTPEDFGGLDTFTVLAPKSFMARQDTSGATAAYNGGSEGCCINLTRLAGSDTFWDSPVDLPSGALLKDFRLYAADADAGVDVTLFVFEMCQPEAGGASSFTTIATAATTGTGNQAPAGLVTPNLTVNNRTCTYTARVRLDGTTTQTLQKVRVRWARQVSPAPATATFSDVPTSDPRFRFVQALVAAGITGGCGPGVYCPNDPVTRGQMAVFISVALGLAFQ